MVIDSVATLVNLVTKNRLLEPLQQDELMRELQGQYADPKQLAKAMLEREWLTSMQINHLFQGRVSELIIGSYILRERLGESRAGQVYKARHLHLRRIAAVKIVREDLLADPDIVERFYQEIQATSSLDHPNIIHAYDAGPVGKTHFFAMEHAKGTDLWRLVKKAGSITVPQACDYITQTALALQHVHERGLLHLDVKPGNLLVTRSSADTPPPSTTPSPTAPSSKTLRGGLIKIRNLGLTALEDRASALFLKGRFRGDPDCRAPELADPAANPDVRSELYSLGCTFYFLLTGQPPFPEGTPAEKMRRHQTEEPTAIELLRPGVPPGIQAIVSRLLAKNPAERFQNAAEVVAALSQGGSSVNLSADAAATGSSSSSARHGITTFRRFLSAVGLRAKKQAGSLMSAGSGLRKGAVRPSGLRWKIAVSAVLALCFLVVVGSLAWKAAGRKTKDASDDSVQGIWERLRERGDDSKLDATQYREEVRSFRWKYPGTPQAAQAEALLAKLSSPLDSLDGKNIGKLERAGFKDDLVAVLGTHRGRHWSEADCLAFTPDGKLLASGGYDKDIRIWDVNTMEEWAVLRGHTARVAALSFATDRLLASSSDDTTVRIWDIGKAKQEPIDIKGHVGAVAALAFSPTAKKLACGGADKVVRIWDLTDKTPKATALPAHGNIVTCLAFSSDGNTLATGSADAMVRLFDVATAKPKEPVLKGHVGLVLSVAFSPDGTMLASGGQDKTVRLWKVDGSAGPAPLAGHSNMVRSVAFCSDGKTLASAGDDRTIILWNVAAPMPQQVVSITAHATRIDALAFAPDGKTLASCGEDTTVRLWNVAGTATNERAVYPGHYGAVTTLAFSADFKSLASGGIDGTARIWDLTKSEPRERLALRGHPAAVAALKFIKDDRGLLTGCADLHVRSWDLTAAAPKPDPVIPGILTTSSSSVAVSPDGRTMITAVNGKLALLDTTTNKARDWLTLPGGTPSSLLIAPDGRHLIVGNANGSIYILRIPTGAARAK